MRSIPVTSCLLALAVLLSGCIQSPPAGSPGPEQTGSVTILDIPEPATTAPVSRAVNISAEETRDSIIIRVDGGDGAASLASLSVRVTNHDGSTFQRTINAPEIAKPYVFTYSGYANAAKVNIVGTFSDGYQQTLLITSL